MKKRVIYWGWILLLIFGGCRSDDMRLQVSFDRIAGLKEGDRVLFQNQDAGTVRAIEYQKDGSYSVAIAVKEEFSPKLTEHSQFNLVEAPGQEKKWAIEIRQLREGGQPLADGASVTGVDPLDSALSRWRRSMEKGFQFLQEQMDRFGRDLQQFPDSEEYRNLKKMLDAWAADIDRAGQDTRKKLEEQWLPRIQKELERLRKKLREQGREKEMEPLQREVERIRNI